MRYYEGVLYDLLTSHSDDIQMYRELAGMRGKKLLELGIGTGRVGLELACEGFDVTGIELSDKMLHLAKKKAAGRKINIRLIRGDMRNFELDEKFDLIYITYNSILHLLKDEEVTRLLECVKKHLKKEGAFLIDVYNPALGVVQSAEEYFFREFPDPESGHKIELFLRHEYDKQLRVETVHWSFRKEKKEIETEVIRIRAYAPGELDNYLASNGFVIRGLFGSYQMDPYDERSFKRIILAELK